MIRNLARVLAGFVLACLTAGLVQVLFARPPGALLGAPASEGAERASDLAVLVLLAATHAAIFAAAFGLIAAGIGEWTGTRAMAYYLFTGTIIALLGFIAQYSSEAPGQATVFNNYALKAYLTSGFFAGLVYWLMAGRKAGGSADDPVRDAAGAENTIGVPPPARTWKNRPRLIIEDAPKPGTKVSRKASLAERLADADAPAAKTAQTDVTTDPVKSGQGAAKPQPSTPQPAKPAEQLPPKPASTTSVPTTKPGSTGKPTDQPAAGADGPAPGSAPSSGPSSGPGEPKKV